VCVGKNIFPVNKPEQTWNVAPLPTNLKEGKMRNLTKILAVLALTVALGVGTANALTLNYASISNAVLEFNGTNSTFQFLPESTPGYDFQITDQTPGSGSIGLFGNISGLFTIGQVQQFLPGFVEYAIVSGTGTLTIAADSLFTGTLQWVDIGTIGASGGLNILAQANLFPVNYTGSNPDLLSFLSGGLSTLTFQFPTIMPLSILAQGGGNQQTSYSGSMSPIPLPPSALLLGSGILGLVAFSWRRGRKED